MLSLKTIPVSEPGGALLVWLKATLVVTLVVLAILPPGQAKAAEVWEVPGAGLSEDHPVFKLEGTIEDGDLERVIRMIDALGGSYPGVLLNSPGGSYSEGVALAELFLERGVRTEVASGDTCLSACAIAFLGGTSFTYSGKGSLIYRTIQPGGVVGFHAPFIDLPAGGSFSSEQLESAFRTAVESVTALTEVAGPANVDQMFVAEILRPSSNELRYLRTVDDFGRLFIKVPDVMKTKTPSTTNTLENICHNAWAWNYIDRGSYTPEFMYYPFTNSAIRPEGEFPGPPYEVVAVTREGKQSCYALKLDPRYNVHNSPTCVVLDYNEYGYSVDWTHDVAQSCMDGYRRAHVPPWAALDADAALLE